MSDSSAVDATFARIEAELGPPDILVNNAGAIGMDHLRRVKPLMRAAAQEAADGGVTTPLDALVRLTDEEWRRMLAIHLDGTFYCTRAAVRSMAPRGSGAIVNMSSICGLEGCTGHPHYSAAKAAVLGFTKAAGKELIVQGIRVNAVAPGHVGTATLAGRDRRGASRDRRSRRPPGGWPSRRRSRPPSRSSPPTTPATSSARCSARTAGSSPRKAAPACSIPARTERTHVGVSY